MIKISSPEGIINAIKSAISGLNSGVDGALDKQMAKVSKQAFEKAKEMAADRLNRTKQQYIDALSLEKVAPNVYVVRLDASAAHIEEGYGRYDMKPGLLGLNSSGPKPGVKTSKMGYKYRSIPFDNSDAPGRKNHPLHNTVIQKDRVPDNFLGDPGRGPGSVNPSQQSTMGEQAGFMSAIKKAGNKFAGQTPQDFRGKAWSFQQNENNKHEGFINTWDGRQQRINLGRPIPANLNNLMNLRAPHENGGNKVRSAYVTFRTVSENPTQKGKWWHPGYEGAKIFPDLQRWTEDNFARMAEAVLRNVG